MWCCYLLMWLCIYVGIMKLLCMAQASRKATPCHYWTPSVASRSCPRLVLPTAAPQKLALTLIPTWMSTPALLQLGLSLLSNLRGHNLSTGVDRAAETPAPSTAHHDDAQAPAPAPHHALKFVRSAAKSRPLQCLEQTAITEQLLRETRCVLPGGTPCGGSVARSGRQLSPSHYVDKGLLRIHW